MNERALNREKWQKLIEEQEKSGLTQAEFCQQRNIVLSQFVYYRGITKGKSKSPPESNPLMPIKISKPLSKISSEIKLVLPNGLQCMVPSEIDITQIKLLVEALLRC